STARRPGYCHGPGGKHASSSNSGTTGSARVSSALTRCVHPNAVSRSAADREGHRLPLISANLELLAAEGAVQQIDIVELSLVGDGRDLTGQLAGEILQG